MALISCPDCSNSVSDQAISCVKCGRPIRQDTQRLNRWCYYQRIQQFWLDIVWPGIKQCLIFFMTFFIAMLAKFISILFFVPGVMQRYSLTDIGMNAISNSGVFIVVSFIILCVIVKCRWIAWLNKIFSPEYEAKFYSYISKERWENVAVAFSVIVVLCWVNFK